MGWSCPLEKLKPTDQHITARDITRSKRCWWQDGGLGELQQGQVVLARVPEGPTWVQPHLLHTPRLVLGYPPADVCHTSGGTMCRTG